MAEMYRAFTRPMAREKLFAALAELTDLYNDDFGDGSDVHEDGEALQRAIDAIDDVLLAMDGPDDDDEETDDEDDYDAGDEP